MGEKLEVLIIDEQPIVRWALNHLLQSQEGVRVVAEAGSIAEAALSLNSHIPDAVIMDIDPYDNIKAAAVMEFIKSRNWRTLAMSAHDTWDHVEWFFKAGGLGFMSKRSPITEVLPALRAVAQGKQWVSPSIRSAPVIGILRRNSIDRDILSSREREIATLVAKGLTSKQIAEQLCVSLKTVEAHRYRVFRKLNIQRSAQLVEYILRNPPSDSSIKSRK